MKSFYNKTILCVCTLLVLSTIAFAQSTGFNYQGKLNDGANPANGNYQLQFRLFDAAMGGAPIGLTLSDVQVTATQGVFSVKLDFGAAVFTGANRFLEISVRHNAGEAYTTLNPREQIASSPYSIRTLSAASADVATNAQQLGGVPANQYLRTNGDGSALTSLNAASISTGTLSNARLGQLPTANIADNAVTAPKIASGQVVKGVTVGAATLTDSVTLAQGNNITITPAGNTLTIASTSGGVSGSGTTNAIPLWSAGTTLGNSQITQSAAGNVGIGTSNPVFGRLQVAPDNNGNGMHSQGTTGTAVFGESAGGRGVVGYSNTSIGVEGSSFGANIGVYGFSQSGVGVFGATGFGSGRIALLASGSSWFKGDTTPLSVSNTGAGTGIVVGSSGNLGHMFAYDYSAGQPRDLLLNHPGGNVGVGTTTPAARLDVNGSFMGRGGATITGTNGEGAVVTARRSDGDALIIIDSPLTNQNSVLAFRKGNLNRWLMFADNSPEAGTAGGSNFRLDAYNNFGGGIATHLFVERDLGFVGLGTTAPQRRLDVNGTARVRSIPQLPSFSSVCFSAAGDLLQCGGSSLRWKTNVQRFSDGLSILRQLRPISYNWKDGGAYDIGLGAEDVAEVAPFFAFRNKEGVVEGVRYERLNMLLINSVNQQQEQIEVLGKQNQSQQELIEQQRKRIESLIRIVCVGNPKADICRR